MTIENFSDTCLFLLGAGISADADVPISSALNKRVRQVIQSQYPEPLSLQQRLLNFLVGAVYFHRGITNSNPESGEVNIEEILSCLHMLKTRNSQLLSAFVGNWHSQIDDFSYSFLEEFDRKLRTIVIDSLKGNPSKMGYFEWFSRLHKNYNSTVNVFTLNQDIVLESALKAVGYNYSTGFDSGGNWNPYLFDGVEANGGNSINIFKLHGSLGWKRNEYDSIVCEEMINVSDNHLMIFGILDKVTLEEPYFELIKRLKEKARQVSLIVTIGYSFSDTHINDILFDSLRIAKNKKVLIVDKSTRPVLTRLSQKYSKSTNLRLISTFGDGLGANELLSTTKLNDKIEEMIAGSQETPF
jgi:hypothetical protein